MWGFFAGCFALLALTLIFVLYPWWAKRRPRSESMRDILTHAYNLRRNELQQDVEIGWLSPELFGEAEAELDRSLLEDVEEVGEGAIEPARQKGRTAVWLALGVVVVSIGLMLASSELTRFAIFGGAPDSTEQIETLHERLLRQVDESPQEANAWAELGDFYREQGQGPEAVSAWMHANALLEYSDPSALVALADAMAMAGGDWFSDEAMGYLSRALDLDPAHQKALWLFGWASWQRENAEAAVQSWERLLMVLPAEEEGVRAMVENWLDEARREAGEPEIGPSLQVEVALDPAFVEAFDPDATLFVYARRIDGPPMPLAIWRGVASEFPVQVVLDDTLAMMPEMNLSKAREVIVVARISESGQAERQSGDLIGEVGPVAVIPNAMTQVTIDQRIP